MGQITDKTYVDRRISTLNTNLTSAISTAKNEATEAPPPKGRIITVCVNRLSGGTACFGIVNGALNLPAGATLRDISNKITERYPGTSWSHVVGSPSEGQPTITVEFFYRYA